jgi:hypothetical protein
MTTNASNFARARSALRFTTQPTWGNVLFADSVAGSASGGFTADGGAATLIAAQTLATASNGDTVYVSPGHAESVIGAAGMTFSKAGVRYQGLGVGRNRPTITFSTSTAAQILVTGANITFDNFIFDLTGIDAIVAAFLVTANDVTFSNCEFIMQAAAASPALGILTAATAARFNVNNCRFLGLATTSGGTLAACIQHEVGVDFAFYDNFFRAKMTQAILNATTILGGLIRNNYIHVYTGTKGIALAAGTTGFGCNNRLVVASGTSPIVGAGFSWTGDGFTTEALTIGTPAAVAW